MGPRPIVGISEGFADYGDYYGFGYGRPLLAAGALPVLLPYYERAEDRVELLERLDGLVLAGGRDIEAWRYGRAEPHPKHLPGQPLLDEIELHYARAAVEAGLPLLAICRGCQVLNVAFGGTLYGDLEEFPEGGADHPGAKWDEWRALVDATLEGTERPPHPTHPVEIEPGSMLASHLGSSATWSTATTIRRSTGSARVSRPWRGHRTAWSRGSRCPGPARSSSASSGSCTRSGRTTSARSASGGRSSEAAAERADAREAATVG